MNYAEEIIKLVPQIRNESGLKSLYGFAKRVKTAGDKQPVATLQPEGNQADIAGSYKEFIIDLLEDVSSIKALKFIYSYLQVHIRKKGKLQNIVQSQYQEPGESEMIKT